MAFIFYVIHKYCVLLFIHILYIKEVAKRVRPLSSLIRDPNAKAPHLDEGDSDVDLGDKENIANDDDSDFICEVEKEEVEKRSRKEVEKEKDYDSNQIGSKNITPEVNQEANRSPVFIAIKKRGSTVTLVKDSLPKMREVLKKEISVEELIRLSEIGEFPDKQFLIGNFY